MTDTKCRKWQITLNNPQDKNVTHDKMKLELSTIKSLVYYCLADEIGLETNTPHTHIYTVFKTPVRFSTLKRRFPEGHIEQARGTSEENRAYIEKSGKWADDAKSDTRCPGTFEEWGEIPEEQQGFRSDLGRLYEMVKDGKSDFEILETCPDFMTRLTDISRARQIILTEEYRSTFQPKDVTYIYGPTGTGKTRFVMEREGYAAVYRVTEYEHPFDAYAGQQTLVLDEYRSQIKMTVILNLLDGYPCVLPCRYADKVGCFDSVFIISNISLEEQYPEVQRTYPQRWAAFLRRIRRVVKFFEDGHVNVYDMKDYPHSFIELDAHELPDVFLFDQEKKPPEYGKSDQTKLPMLKATSTFLDGVLGIGDKVENAITGGASNGESQETGGNP